MHFMKVGSLLNIELEYDDDSNCGSSSRNSTYNNKLNQLDDFYTISPNPAQSHFTLRGSSSSFIHQIVLIDLNGKEIIKYLVDEKLTERNFNLPNLSDGVYNATIILEI
jgi:Secretion system C-terminal sorting domain